MHTIGIASIHLQVETLFVAQFLFFSKQDIGLNVVTQSGQDCIFIHLGHQNGRPFYQYFYIQSTQKSE